VRAAYVRKNTNNEFTSSAGATPLDISRVGRFTVPVTVTVPIRDFVNGVTGAQTFNLMDLPDVPTPVNQFTNIPDGSYKYDTLQLAFNKRFATGLFIQSSYDYQWRDELRRADNISGSPLTSDPMATGFFLNPNPSISNRQQTTNWQGRLIGRYVFKYDVGIAANLRVQSGYPYSRVISATLPNAGTLRFFSANLDQRSDTATIVDLRADKAFHIGRYRFTGMVDAFNVGNSNAVTNFTMVNGAGYNQIIAALDPRVVQFGIRFAF
jgi:hypothetical protein